MMNQSASILRVALLLLLLLVYSTDAKIEIITSTQDVKVGESVLLLCKARAEGTVTWLKDGDEVDESLVENVDENSSKFIIKRAAMTDAGKYTCQFEFESGHTDETEIQLYMYDGPSFGSTVAYHEFLEGTDAVVPCVTSGQPKVVVYWLRGGEEISSDEGRRVHQTQDDSILIRKVKRDDAGSYVCKAQIKGRPIYQELTVSVVVNVPPSVHMKEEVKTVIAGQETNVSLLCLVDGHPKPNINWTIPKSSDPSRHHFNSDRSELTIQSVAKEDYGEYVCTATNKIAEASSIIMLQVHEAPDVFVSAEKLHVSVGQNVSVSCNVSGHPQPELHWLNKQNGQTVGSTSDRVHVVDGKFVIKEVLPSDGGLYSCMAVSSTGNASRDVAILTTPGHPPYLSVSSVSNSVLFSLKTSPDNGGTPITGYALQWRQNATAEWQQIMVTTSDALAINSLKPFTQYMVRLAAVNAEGVGEFSETKTIRTQGMRGEPDTPVLTASEMKIEGNSFYIPLKSVHDGESPVKRFIIRYRQDKEGAEWSEAELPSDADSVSLKDLSFNAKYQMEVTAVNANGSSSPAMHSFTVAAQSGNMTKGAVVAIVMLIFLLVFLVVDATCCYRNRCGLLMFIAVKLFGQKIPALKGFEEGDGTTNGGLNLKGISTPRGSMQQTGVQTKEVGQLTEVTCDKAPLTKHEKIQPGRGLPTDA